MKKVTLLTIMVFLLCSIAYAQSFEHPVEMENKECITCHMEGSTDDMAADPTAYNQWQKSLHGLNNVRCAVCHGEESTFKPDGNINTCLACHPYETTNINAKVDKGENGLLCTSCHKVHTFTAEDKSKKVHSK